jgi:hypothetical protein
MKPVVETTLSASLLVQWGTLFMNFDALLRPLPEVHQILRSVLSLETLVQVIQLSFYTWYSFQIHRIPDVTRYRYADWIVTTPLMLFTTMVYYEYRNRKDSFTLEDFWNKYWKDVLAVGGFNLVMLVFGYLQELGKIGLVTSSVGGFAGLFASFYIIYKDFASKTADNLPLFFFMFSVWSLYGIAAWFGVATKNASYNILDIFSKNFYGVFLSLLILSLSGTPVLQNNVRGVQG